MTQSTSALVKPAALAVPWGYLAGLTATIAVALVAASAVIARWSDREQISAYRDT